MASKKAAPKARKPGKSALPARTPARKAPAPKAAAHKPTSHKDSARKEEGRKPMASAKRTAPARESHKAAPHKDASREPARAAPKAAAAARPVKAVPAAKVAPAAKVVPVIKAAPVVRAVPSTKVAPPRVINTLAPAPRIAQRVEARVEGEEVDGAEPGSLLAGPRNVKPYIAKRGEQYMGKAQLEHFRDILASWKRDLMVEVDRTVTHMKDEAANFPDPNDRATQEEEFSLELRTRDRERKLIRKIDEALKRIEDGSYGYCLETGEEIGIKRLEARPVATLSIEAQERRERRERQYGDRDDRYR